MATKPRSKISIQNKILSRSDDIIAELFKLAFETRQPAVKLGALRTLLNKVLPDLKVTELQGNQDKPIGVVILPALNEKPKDNMDTTSGATERSSKKN